MTIYAEHVAAPPGAPLNAPEGHAHPNYPDTPQIIRGLDDLETATDSGTNYGGRIRGFLKAPTNGDYEIFLTSRHHSQLWLKMPLLK